MAKPGPARKLTVVTEREGNPGHRTKSKLSRGVRLQPGAPPEPDWAELFPPRAVFVPRRRKNETDDERNHRETASIDRDRAKEDARLAVKWASETWRRVVGILDAQGIVSDLDWLVLEDLVVTVVRIRQAEREVSEYGLRQLGERGWQRNGSITTATQYRTHLRWLCGELGLSPAARDGLEAGGDHHGEEGDFDV